MVDGDDIAKLARALTRLAAVPGELERLGAEVALLRKDLSAVRRTLPPILANVGEAARRLGLNVTPEWRHVRDGRQPAVRIGTAVRVDPSRLRSADRDDVAHLARAAHESPPLPRVSGSGHAACTEVA
jgi:hypothetical protein